MRIVTKYLLKELAGPFLATLLISTIILAAANIVQTADMVMNKGVSLFQVTQLFLFFLPYVLIFTIPLSVLSAVLLGFGRLSGDNEVTTLRTSGISIFKVILPVVVCGLLISLINIPLNDKVFPQSEFEARKLAKSIGMKNPIALLEPGVVVKGFKDYIIFVDNIRGNILENISIIQPRLGSPTRTIVAKRGKVIPLPEENSVKLKLEDGTADEISLDSSEEYYKLTFKDYYMTLDLKDAIDVNSIQKKSREKNIKEILREVKQLQGKDIKEARKLRIELHKKIALAFSNLVFILIGIPLAITTHRREKFVGVALAGMLFLMYWGIMLGGIACSIIGIVPAWIGVWSGNAVLFVIGVALFYRITAK